MARQKTRKTALKRLRKTNPKGNRKAKILFKPSAQHHLKSKLSRRAKRRKPSHKTVNQNVEKKFNKFVPL